MKSDEIKHDEYDKNMPLIVPVYTLRYDKKTPLKDVVEILRKDTERFPVHVRLPENEISEVGAALIKGKVNKYVNTTKVGRPLHSENWQKFVKEYGGWIWLTKAAPNPGTLPKRISKFLHKEFALKLPPSILSQIGSLGSEHCEKTGSYWIDIDINMDWEPGDFGDDNSCFFKGGQYSHSLDWLREHGYALRFFYEPGATQVYKENENPRKYQLSGWARSFFVAHENIIALFNGYGAEQNNCDMYTIKQARILSHVLGLSYKKATITHDGSVDDMVYFNNGGLSYVLGHWHYIKDIDEYDIAKDNSRPVYCHKCNLKMLPSYVWLEARRSEDRNAHVILCQVCTSEARDVGEVFECYYCKNKIFGERVKTTHDDVFYCKHCAAGASRCVVCGILDPFHMRSVTIATNHSTTSLESCDPRVLEASFSTNGALLCGDCFKIYMNNMSRMNRVADIRAARRKIDAARESEVANV